MASYLCYVLLFVGCGGLCMAVIPKTCIEKKCKDELKMGKAGCFYDSRLVDRVTLFKKTINWRNMAPYECSITCQCARAAKGKGYKMFAIRNWEECIGITKVLTKVRATACVKADGRTTSCGDSDECIGGRDLFIYTLPSKSTNPSLANPCNFANGGCNQICTNNNGNVVCFCGTGYELTGNGKTCQNGMPGKGGMPGMGMGGMPGMGMGGMPGMGMGGMPETGAVPPGKGAMPEKRGMPGMGMGGHITLISGRHEINPCKTANGGCGQICTNKNGNAVCECDKGYALTGNGKMCGKATTCIQKKCKVELNMGQAGCFYDSRVPDTVRLFQKKWTQIKWNNLAPYECSITCQCARAAKSKGYKMFAVRKLLECIGIAKLRTKKRSTECIKADGRYTSCGDSDECIGMRDLFIYTLP